MDLIEAIEREQEERGFTSTQLANLLGIDLSTWSRIKNRKRPPGGKFLRAAMSNLPEVSMAVIDYMRDKGGVNGNSTNK